MEAKQMQLQNFFIFLMDCICIVLSYILASYLRFGNLWGGYTKGIELLCDLLSKDLPPESQTQMKKIMSLMSMNRSHPAP